MNSFTRPAQTPEESDAEFLKREAERDAWLREQRGKLSRTRAHIQDLMKGAKNMDEPETRRI